MKKLSNLCPEAGASIASIGPTSEEHDFVFISLQPAC